MYDIWNPDWIILQQLKTYFLIPLTRLFWPSYLPSILHISFKTCCVVKKKWRIVLTQKDNCRKSQLGQVELLRRQAARMPKRGSRSRRVTAVSLTSGCHSWGQGERAGLFIVRLWVENCTLIRLGTSGRSYWKARKTQHRPLPLSRSSIPALSIDL